MQKNLPVSITVASCFRIISESNGGEKLCTILYFCLSSNILSHL